MAGRLETPEGRRPSSCTRTCAGSIGESSPASPHKPTTGPGEGLVFRKPQAGGKGPGTLPSGAREAGSRGVLREDFVRGGGEKEAGAPRTPAPEPAAVTHQAAWPSWVNLDLSASKAPLHNHRCFEDAGMKGLGSPNYPGSHSPRDPAGPRLLCAGIQESAGGCPPIPATSPCSFLNLGYRMWPHMERLEDTAVLGVPQAGVGGRG